MLLLILWMLKLLNSLLLLGYPDPIVFAQKQTGGSQLRFGAISGSLQVPMALSDLERQDERSILGGSPYIIRPYIRAAGAPIFFGLPIMRTQSTNFCIVMSFFVLHNNQQTSSWSITLRVINF